MSVVAHVRGAWLTTKEMPLLLRVYCQGAMVVAPLALLFVALPLFDWTVDGRVVFYAELWSSGAGVILSLCLALVGVGGWALAARRSIGRWAWVAAPSVPLLAIPFSPASSLLSDLRDASLIASMLLTSGAVYAVLFHAPSVLRFLARNEIDRQSA